MKNKLLQYFLLTALVLLSIGCTESFNYKFQDKEQSINCPNEDNKLLNEALHSFEFDIASYYQSINPDIDYLNIDLAYANFIYLGAKGDIDLNKIVSEHSLSILKLLKEKEYIISQQTQATNLNYKNNLVTCLVNQFKNEDLKTSIISQIEINFLNPKIMADNYRMNIRDVQSDKNFAMFLAFETYYQYLADMDFSNFKKNE